MGQTRVCDKCRRVLKYASDTKIKIYYHPYGNLDYELCPKCTAELRAWLDNENPFNLEVRK